jgi:Flp pilus assembly pilin Flp
MPQSHAPEPASDARFSRWEREEGQTMVEYGFVLVAVALVAIAAYTAFGGRVADLVNTVNIT